MRVVWIVIVWMLCGCEVQSAEKLTTELYQTEMQKQTDRVLKKETEKTVRDMVEEESKDTAMLDEIESYLNLGEIEAALGEFSVTEQFSFLESVKSLISGKVPLDFQELKALVIEAFLGEVAQQKNRAVRILVVVLVSAVFTSFVRVFENSQIADISFYMMYLLISTMLVESFGAMNGIVSNTCSDLAGFMKILMPSYLVTVVLSAGSVSAVGFYEIIILAMNLIQIFIIKIILPAINFYLVLLILNQMGKEDYFSKLAELVELVIGWILKSILGIVLGLQAVQCLVAPAVDSLKNSAMHRLVKMVPGIGSVIDTAAETVAGSAVVIKNAVGIAGMLVLVVICLTPLVKLAVCILIFRLLCGMIQPFCEKRMVEGIESISRGTALLLRVQMTGLAVFLISLAMITAAVSGG